MSLAPKLDPANLITSPTATEALELWYKNEPQADSTDFDPMDMSRAVLYSDDTWQEPFANMREAAPINKVEQSAYGPYWNVCSYKAIQHVEALPELYSSEEGGIVIADTRTQGEFDLPMFIAMDRPKHTGQRRTVASAFTPTQMKLMEDEIRVRTSKVLDDLPWNKEFDWVHRVSIELTTDMLAILLGFPWKDRRMLSFWSDWAGDLELLRVPKLDDLRKTILFQMGSYFQGLWDSRVNSEPATDLISMMIHSDSMQNMETMEFIGNLVLLLVGGNDTTRNTMTGIAYGLDKFPDQRSVLQSNPEIIPNAIQEFIRWQTPLAHMRRTATQDTVLFGNEIGKGDKLILWYISANRDEDIFADGDQINLNRENARRHLAFGYGIHRCVGARLAELQIRVLMEEMHRRRMQVNVTGDVKRVNACFVHGFRRLMVSLSKY